MSITINIDKFENDPGKNWALNDKENNIDPDDFERIYQEYCDQCLWIERENELYPDADDLDCVYPSPQ
jgi:hypothetical protein